MYLYKHISRWYMYISSIYHVTSLYLWYVLVVLSEQTTWMTSTRLAGAEGLEATNRRPQNMVVFLNRRKTTTRCGSLFCISHHLGIYMFIYIYVYILYIILIYINIVWLFMPEFGKKVESGYKILDRMFDDSWNQHFWSQSSFLESAINVPPGSQR